MKLGEKEGASGKNPALRRMLQEIENWCTAAELHLGFQPQAGSQRIDRQIAPPPQASYVVTGGNDQYTISITNPVDVSGGVILHEIVAATTVPISTATDKIVRGPAPDQVVVIIDPGTTRYFQLRSKFVHSAFNQPLISEAVSS